MQNHTYSEKFFDKLSNICLDIAQICFGSIVIPFVINDIQWILVAAGLIAASFFWWLSLKLIEEAE